MEGFFLEQDPEKMFLTVNLAALEEFGAKLLDCPDVDEAYDLVRQLCDRAVDEFRQQELAKARRRAVRCATPPGVVSEWLQAPEPKPEPHQEQRPGKGADAIQLSWPMPAPPPVEQAMTDVLRRPKVPEQSATPSGAKTVGTMTSGVLTADIECQTEPVIPTVRPNDLEGSWCEIEALLVESRRAAKAARALEDQALLMYDHFRDHTNASRLTAGWDAYVQQVRRARADQERGQRERSRAEEAERKRREEEFRQADLIRRKHRADELRREAEKEEAEAEARKKAAADKLRQAEALLGNPPKLPHGLAYRQQWPGESPVLLQDPAVSTTQPGTIPRRPAQQQPRPDRRGKSRARSAKGERPTAGYENPPPKPQHRPQGVPPEAPSRYVSPGLASFCKKLDDRPVPGRTKKVCSVCGHPGVHDYEKCPDLKRHQWANKALMSEMRRAHQRAFPDFPS